ncbi:MAG: hypothetical protein Q8S84_01800 [bacterium]|nr:hypothetical protein [bacterium]
MTSPADIFHLYVDLLLESNFTSISHHFTSTLSIDQLLTNILLSNHTFSNNSTFVSFGT